ncbi:flagellar filament capping protein FliD [Cupriavidus basilensis]
MKFRRALSPGPELEQYRRHQQYAHLGDFERWRQRAVSDLVANDPAAHAKHATDRHPPRNAALTVNNIAIQSPSNQVSGAVQGATLPLAQTGTSNIVVQRDTASIQRRRAEPSSRLTMYLQKAASQPVGL